MAVGVANASVEINSALAQAASSGCTAPSFVLIGYSQGAAVARETVSQNPHVDFLGLALIGDPLHVGLSDGVQRYTESPGNSGRLGEGLLYQAAKSTALGSSP